MRSQPHTHTHRVQEGKGFLLALHSLLDFILSCAGRVPLLGNSLKSLLLITYFPRLLLLRPQADTVQTLGGI